MCQCSGPRAWWSGAMLSSERRPSTNARILLPTCLSWQGRKQRARGGHPVANAQPRSTRGHCPVAPDAKPLRVTRITPVSNNPNSLFSLAGRAPAQ